MLHTLARKTKVTNGAKSKIVTFEQKIRKKLKVSCCIPWREKQKLQTARKVKL